MSFFKQGPSPDPVAGDNTADAPTIPTPEFKTDVTENLSPEALENSEPEHVQTDNLQDADPSVVNAAAEPPEPLTCENATHFKAPNGRVFATTDVLRRIAISDRKLQPCDAPQVAEDSE